MLEVVQKIFEQNIELLLQADKTIIYLREEEYEKALSIIADTADYINYVAEAIIQNRDYFQLVSTESVMEMLEGILIAKKQKDYVLLADLFEMQLVNFICSVQELIMKKEDFLAFNELDYYKNIVLLQSKIMQSERELSWLSEDEINQKDRLLSIELDKSLNPVQLLEQGYCVEFTTCGLMTLGAKDEHGDKFYMHTNHKVGQESFLLAKRWHSNETESYIIYGYGMGYHVGELLNLAIDARIEIYESDMNILKLSCAFSRMTALLEHENVKIYYDPDYKQIEKRLQQVESKEKICIHYPSLRNIKDTNAKEMLKQYIPWANRVERC